MTPEEVKKLMSKEQVTGMAVGKTVLAVAVFAGLLAAYKKWVDPSKGIAAGIFEQARHIQWSHKPKPVVAVKPAVEPPVKHKPGARKPISQFLWDDAGALDSFYEALDALAKPDGAQVVTVLHYGDSPTTADLITGDVREMLQKQFGDAGRGYLLTAKPWAWYQHRGVDISDHGWTNSTAVGKGHEETYGLGGASFEGGEGAGSKVSLRDANQASMELSYLQRPNGGQVSVAANGDVVTTVSTAGEGTAPEWKTVALPAGAKTVELKVSAGNVRMFGETFRTGKRGVLYDSLGLNGASTTVLANGFKESAWAAELRHEQPKLVIINYGTNESGFGSYVDKYYEPSLRTAIRRVRSALPGVAILIMSPMDRGRRTGVDEIETYDTIPRIVAIQKRVAAEQGCAFFDTFNAMGGDGTMSRWYTGHPRLVAGDLIHPTPQGAGMVAGLLVKDLMAGYDVYTKRERMAAAKPSAPATGKAK